MGSREGYHRLKGAYTPSTAQCRVLDGVAAGESNASIAERLGLSVETVKWHVRTLLAETNCPDREGLARWWTAQGRRGHGTFLPFLALTRLAVAGIAIGVLGLVVGVAVVASRVPNRSKTGAAAASQGCASTPIQHDVVPAWLYAAAGQNVPVGVPYAIASPPTAAGFIFPNPPRAGHPSNPANKILWVVTGSRNGAPLQLDGHLLGSTAPAVHMSEPANAGPGEIYPSIVDVPTAGCWQFTLHWATGQTTIDLEYQNP